MTQNYYNVEATNFDDETVTVLENFCGTYSEAQEKIQNMLNEIEKEYGFIHTFEYIQF